MKRCTVAIVCLLALGAGHLTAADLAISIGVRETQADGGASGGPIFSNHGNTGGIEFVNLDGQTLVADGTWQLFTFTPEVDTLTAFAGTTADSILDGEWGTLEMLRVSNIDGITLPIRLWLDNVTNTTSSGPTTEGFETFAAGNEVMFQEPSFSGSTAANLLPGSTSAVTDATAFSGSQSYEMNFQFVDATTTRWVRVSTFDTPSLPNPAVRLRESIFDPTISFYAKAIVVPEPASLILLILGGAAALGVRRRRTAG